MIKFCLWFLSQVFKQIFLVLVEVCSRSAVVIYAMAIPHSNSITVVKTLETQLINNM